MHAWMHMNEWQLTAANALMLLPVFGWTSAGAPSSSSSLEPELPAADVDAVTVFDRSASSSCCRRARRDIAAAGGGGDGGG